MLPGSTGPFAKGDIGLHSIHPIIILRTDAVYPMYAVVWACLCALPCVALVVSTFAVLQHRPLPYYQMCVETCGFMFPRATLTSFFFPFAVQCCNTGSMCLEDCWTAVLTCPARYLSFQYIPYCHPVPYRIVVPTGGHFLAQL